MLLEDVERLKKEYTDKYVVADAVQPELRRFQGLTGRVVTVNMSGRALVQFDHPVDVSWYDIDLSYLTVVPKPAPKPVETKKAAPEAKPAAAPSPAAATAPAAAPAAGAKKMSPLEMARAEAARKAAGGAAPAPAPAAAAPAAPAAAPSGKPMSPLERARAEVAARKAKEGG